MNYERASPANRKWLVMQDLLAFGLTGYAFMGIPICRECYMRLHHISHNCIDDARAQLHSLRDGNTVERSQSITHGRVAIVEERVRQFLLEEWLPVNTMVNARTPGSRVCCYVPTGRWVWYECESHIGAVSYRTFMRVFDDVMAKVDTPHTNSDLKHCQRCFKLACTRLYSARAGDWARAADLDEEMRRHLAIQYAEHQVYWKEIERVHANDAGFTLVSQDATKPVFVPRPTQRTEFNPKKDGLSFQINSLIVHHEFRENCGRLALYLGRGKDGVNDNLSLLDVTLDELRQNGELKPVLHLQLDGGCGLRNKYLIAYLAYRVKLGWFREVLVRFSLADHGGDRNDALTSHFRVGARKEMLWSLPMLLARMAQWYPTVAPRVTVYGDFEAEIAGQALPLLLNCTFQPLLRDWKAFLEPHMHNLSGYVQNNLGASEKSLHVLHIDECGRLKARRLASTDVVGDAGGWSNTVDVLRSVPAPNSQPLRVFFHDRANNLVGQTITPYGTIVEAVLKKFGDAMPVEDREWWWQFGRAMACVKQPTPSTIPKVATKPRPIQDVNMDDRPLIVQCVPRGPVEERVEKGDGNGSGDDCDVVEDQSDTFDGDDPEYRVEAIIGRKKGEDGTILYHVRWAKPYNDETWEPLDHLANAMRLVDNFERIRSGAKCGLTAGGVAHAELGRELWEQEQREAKKSMVACQYCHRSFKKHGVKTHERHCRAKPVK